jgi:hypothetical protein
MGCSSGHQIGQVFFPGRAGFFFSTWRESCPKIL